MNLEETIKHTRKKVEEMAAKSVELFPSCEGRKYLDCAEEYYQLADWLEELKELRKHKEKYRWHDLRKNPDDLPDVEHRKKEYFHVVQEGKETGPTILQYKKDFGFGFYNDFGNGPKFTDVDTNFTAQIVGWKEIEKFESEMERSVMNDEEKEISAEEVLKAMTGLQEGIRWLSYKVKDDYTIKKVKYMQKQLDTIKQYVEEVEKLFDEIYGKNNV